MKLLSLLDHLSTADAPAAAAPRRDLLHRLGQAGARAAIAALPLAAALPAQAAPTDTTLDAVLLLLKLENMLVALYTQALASPALAGAAQAAVRPTLSACCATSRATRSFTAPPCSRPASRRPPRPASTLAAAATMPAIRSCSRTC
ncbi:hypothetical protein [Hymenobacter lapidarius]|uniref:hypothetical protein n=1 Tax=Hymenobacter lapidarius TaxID=1908237 RepID=UPI001EFAD7D6|nr:hypothetical protein [Hymenobacter lapidarius]